ncbi:MATE family efflux transporter [Viridibacillus sp. NPDC096237]|uniref:MATE family efflux transporter n=1 Tax=Viridibacillus sp. NPDC096237 TaxID=3390721 RepID=UPI003CFD1123
MSISIAISVFVAHSVGAEDITKIRHIKIIGIKLNYILGGALVLMIYLLSNPILEMFLDNGETIRVAHTLILISFWGSIRKVRIYNVKGPISQHLYLRN